MSKIRKSEVGRVGSPVAKSRKWKDRKSVVGSCRVGSPVAKKLLTTYYLRLTAVILFTTSGLYGSWADHVVISEFSTGSSRSTKDEFIELYNPTPNNIDISEWRIQFKSAGKKAEWKTRVIIPVDKKIMAYSFYLIANKEPSYTGIRADLTKNYIFGLLSEEGSIRIIDYDGQEIDKAGYGWESADYEKSPAENDGASLSRRDFGFDSDNNKADFIATSNRCPQNSSSIPEVPGSVTTSIGRSRKPGRPGSVNREDKMESEAIYKEARRNLRDNKIFDCIEKLQKVTELDSGNKSAESDLKKIPKDIKRDLEEKKLVGRDQFYGEAVLYYLQKDYVSSANNLKKILLLTPEDVEVREWYEKIKIHLPVEEAEEPAPVLKKIPPKQDVKTDIRKTAASPAPVKTENTSPKENVEKAEEHYNQGLKEYSSGYITKAIEEWELCLKYNPKHERAKNALAKARKTLKK